MSTADKVERRAHKKMGKRGGGERGSAPGLSFSTSMIVRHAERQELCLVLDAHALAQSLSGALCSLKFLFLVLLCYA